MPQRFAVFALALLLAACAGAPAPAPDPAPAAEIQPAPVAAAPEPPPPPAPPPIPRSNRICGVQVGRTVELAELGLPEGSRPVDVALGRDTVWLLFEPALLVGLPRQATEHAPVAIPEFGAVEEMADLIHGPAGAAWSALTVDWDGTLWIVSATRPGLWRKPPGRRPEAVRLTATPAMRQGGFRDVLAGRGSVWTAPACADSAVWRLAPSGKLLGTALDGAPGSCPVASFERDWSGAVWALRPDVGALFQLGPGQAWQPAGAATAPPAPPPSGSEAIDSWFFWGAEPFGLAGDGTEEGTFLYRNVEGRVEALREDCGAGNALVGVAGDERGWVVLTRQWLRVAEHQREEGAAGE